MGRYGNGKATALVVDVGHQNTSVTALWEGMVLKKSESCFLFAAVPCLHDDPTQLTTVDIATGIDETALDRVTSD